MEINPASNDRFERPIRKDIPILDHGTAYSFLFQKEKTKENLILDTLASIMPTPVDSVDLYNLAIKDIEIRSSNTISMKTGSNLLGRQTAIGLLSTSYPQAIELLDLGQRKKLFEELQKDRTITKGVFAGTLLLNTPARTLFDIKNGNSVGTIAIGVIDEKSNEPLGIVFCPEKMLNYKFVDYSEGRKKEILKPVTHGIRVPVGVEI